MLYRHQRGRSPGHVLRRSCYRLGMTMVSRRRAAFLSPLVASTSHTTKRRWHLEAGQGDDDAPALRRSWMLACDIGHSQMWHYAASELRWRVK